MTPAENFPTVPNLIERDRSFAVRETFEKERKSNQSGVSWKKQTRTGGRGGEEEEGKGEREGKEIKEVLII